MICHDCQPGNSREFVELTGNSHEFLYMNDGNSHEFLYVNGRISRELVFVNEGILTNSST